MLIAAQTLNPTLSVILLPVDTHVHDLCFTLIPFLCSGVHVDKVTLHVLGFITRIHLGNLNSPIRLHSFSVVRLIVEHGLVVRDPSTATTSNKPKHIQRGCLRIIKYPFNINCPPFN